MKRFVFFIFTASLVSFCFGFIFRDKIAPAYEKLLPTPTPAPRIFDKYSIDSLTSATVAISEIKIDKLLSENEKYDSYMYKQTFDPTFSNQKSKTVTGLINIPKGEGNFPIVVMFRGYVDPTIYSTGVGTRRAGEVFASNGFITVAPDFFGYGESDTEAGNVFETRFQTYTTAIETIKSLPTINKWNQKDAFIWAHSNGGQIALTTLIATGNNYPTTLWAPVTKPFPYSILYFTDESVDGGKFLRGELAKFEEFYDTDLYSFTNYLDKINAPIQLHQGTNDDAVNWEWSSEFYNKMKSIEKDITYYKYPGADHNLQPSWNDVVNRDLEFFKKYL